MVYRHLKIQLCCHDADEFEWERDRIQTLFLKQLHVFSGGRSGAFVPTGYYPDINLTYGDIDFLLVRDGTGVEKYAICLVQNWMKGNKEKVDKKCVILPSLRSSFSPLAILPCARSTTHLDPVELCKPALIDSQFAAPLVRRRESFGLYSSFFLIHGICGQGFRVAKLSERPPEVHTRIFRRFQNISVQT